MHGAFVGTCSALLRASHSWGKGSLHLHLNACVHVGKRECACERERESVSLYTNFEKDPKFVSNILKASLTICLCLGLAIRYFVSTMVKF